MTDQSNCFYARHWEMMHRCELFNARVWVGCLKNGIGLFKGAQYEQAEAQLTRAYVAGQLFCDTHAVTEEALTVLTDTTSVLHLCLLQQSEINTATELITSTVNSLAQYMTCPVLRTKAMQASRHLFAVQETPVNEVSVPIRLDMCRYLENHNATAH